MAQSTGFWFVVDGEYASDNVLVDIEPESQVVLLSDTGVAVPWVALFHQQRSERRRALSVSPAWSVGQKIGKRRIACVPRVILLCKTRNHQLSDIIDEIAIRQGQVSAESEVSRASMKDWWKVWVRIVTRYVTMGQV